MARGARDRDAEKTRPNGDGPAGPVSPIIVGIGASAGGLDAFQRFFDHMSPDSGLAFVLVPHLDARHRSAMAELIAARTAMRVSEISGEVRPEANQVYIIPPNATLKIEDGVLRPSSPRRSGMTIDEFFQSLAEDQGEHSIGIILSGAGSDGALGLQVIKENGGLTFAQAAASSTFDGMPRSAAATGIVDFILPVEAIPERLVEQAKRLHQLKDGNTAQSFREEVRSNLPKVFAILRTRTGHDFSRYKESTCIRRVQRRMHVLQLISVAPYLETLRKDSREVEALFRDLLIGVTQFFRDARSFEALDRLVLTDIIAEKRPSDTLRVWVPGCATGEEAYSIAILIRERVLKSDKALRVQIFATDLDERSLEIARNGTYPQTIARDVSRSRLDRFFTEHGKTYRISKEIREMVVFSVHNITRDAPFSRIDLVSCRNLLIYFNTELQNQVLGVFHFALRNRGYLFLGPSENVTQQQKLFTKLDAKARIFKAKPATDAPLPGVDFVHTLRPIIPEEVAPTVPSARDTLARRAQRIIESYAPAAVVIDDHHEILHFSGRMGKFLQPSPGTANLNLFNVVDPNLRPELRALVSEAMIAGHRVSRDGVFIHGEGGSQQINMVVEPLPSFGEERRLFLVIFREVEQSPSSRRTPSNEELEANETYQRLEAELTVTRERLQTTIEELETSNEEMKSSNEEFQAVNEELQSANEELEISKEELQSVNEELETVNVELNSRVESLDRALSDRRNLLESIEIPTIFLDRDLRIKTFTPATTDLFHLIETDLGRPVTDIVTRVAGSELPREVNRVLRTLERVEREVALVDGSATFIMRILPYRTVSNLIDGVVITFVDITERKRNEEELGRLAAIVANSPDGVIGLKLDGKISSWNVGASQMYGYESAETIGQSLSMLMPRGKGADLKEFLDRLRRNAAAGPLEAERVAKGGRHFSVSYSLVPIRNSAGKLTEAAIIERDITDQKRAREQQEALVAELNHRVKNSLATVLSISSRALKVSGSLEEFGKALEGRLRALASAHELLARNVWSGADFKQVLLSELAPYYSGKGTDSVETSGRDLFVNSRAALVLGMVFHELATNAAKYGAFSQPAGKVKVSWKRTAGDDGEVLLVDWREVAKGVSPPGKSGFGMGFIERSLAYELHGTTEFRFGRNGLTVTIRIPLAELQERKPEARDE